MFNFQIFIIYAFSSLTYFTLLIFIFSKLDNNYIIVFVQLIYIKLDKFMKYFFQVYCRSTCYALLRNVSHMR